MNHLDKTLVIRECSHDVLKQYNVTREEILDGAVQAYWDDPGLNYSIPFNENKLKCNKASLFSEYVSHFQATYTDHSLENPSSNSKSLLCFEKTDNTDKNGYEYVGTLSLCEALPLSQSECGYDEFSSLSGYKQLIIDILAKYQINGFLAILSTIKLELNINIVLITLAQNFFPNGWWLLEVVNIKSKYHNKGIGTWFITKALNEYVANNNNKNKNNNSEFAVLLTSKISNVENFYGNKMGWQMMQELKLDDIYNESNQLLNVKFYFCLWHKDKKILKNTIDKIHSKIGPNAKYHSIPKCIQILFFPNWLQWLPIDILVKIFTIVTIIYLCLNFLFP